MKAFAIAGLAMLTTAVGPGSPVLAGLGILVALLIAVVCWVISEKSRTDNLVAILTALRSPVVPARSAFLRPGRQREVPKRRDRTR